MPVKTEGKHPGEFIVSEANGYRSRDEVIVTVPAGTKYDVALVLGKITASGKYVAYNNGAADGSEIAAGVLYAALDNTEGGAPADFKGVVFNQDAEVRKADLDWNGQLQAAIDAGLADLAAKGIKAR